MRKTLFALTVLLLTVASPSLAQTGACPTSTATVANPTWVCITASVDHSATDPVTSVPLVTRYDLLFFAPGVDTATGSPIQTINVSKPTPNAQNAMWMQRSELAAIPVGQVYHARAVAVGANGTSGRSPESNPFGRSSSTPPAAPGPTSVSELRSLPSEKVELARLASGPRS